MFCIPFIRDSVRNTKNLCTGELLRKEGRTQGADKVLAVDHMDYNQMIRKLEEGPLVGLHLDKTVISNL